MGPAERNLLLNFDSNGRVTTGLGYIGNAWYYFDAKRRDAVWLAED